MKNGIDFCCYSVFVAIILVISSPSCRGQGHALIVGGVDATIENFPYHVGIYSSLGASGVYNQICGGTLISTKFVISAAHCFWNEKNGAPNNESIYRVAAGKTYRAWLSASDPDTVQRRKIAKLTLPRRYIGIGQSLANDIALVTLNKPVTLTSTVGLADIDWNDAWTSEQMAPGNNGVAVGWGISETGNPSDTLKFISLPYIDPDTCFDSLSQNLKRFLTNDKFCAGFLNNNTSVCPGDSGGGLVFHRPGTDKIFLRGIVSLAFKPAGNDDLCYAQHYAAFTIVSSDVVRTLRAQAEQGMRPRTPSCGRATPRSARGGSSVTETEFPWHAAIYEKTGPRVEDFSYVCGGSLIAAKFVITAAHCFYDEELSTRKNTNNFRVSLGAIKMTFQATRNEEAPTVQSFEIGRVSIHEDYKGSGGNFANNIAVARLERPALFTRMVAPVCIDREEEFDDLKKGAIGVVPGIAVSSNIAQSDTLKWIKLSYVSLEACGVFARTQNSERLVFAPNFCVGTLRKYRMSCRSDTGGGFSVGNSKRAYYLRGVVVVALGHSSFRDQCYTEGYTLTQAIDPFTDWIRDVMVAAESEEE